MDSAALRPPTLAEVRQTAIEILCAIYSPAEARAVVRRLLTYFLPDWEMRWLTSCGQAPFPLPLLPQWQSTLEEVLQGTPLPYILGMTVFLGHTVTIERGVFLPRPETEEWIAWLIQSRSHSPPERILEVGCGSGALLLALGKAFPNAKLFAIDCNPRAIALTQRNLHAHHLPVFAEVHDFLHTPLPEAWQSYLWDLILSNPPYIPHRDKDSVAPNVLTHEPHEALFCEDIEFYERLGHLALEKLSPYGLLVVELYPPTARKVQDYFSILGLEVAMYRDLSGRWRWAAAWHKGKAPIFAPSSGSSSAR